MQVPGGHYSRVVMQGSVARSGVVTGATATGTGVLVAATEVANGASTLITFQVLGTFVGTVTFEGTTYVDGTNMVAIGATSKADNSTVATTATAPGIFYVVVAGLLQVQARVSAYTSGNITVIGVLTA